MFRVDAENKPVNIDTSRMIQRVNVCLKIRIVLSDETGEIFEHVKFRANIASWLTTLVLTEEYP